jgi:hypothetical protein
MAIQLGIASPHEVSQLLKYRDYINHFQSAAVRTRLPLYRIRPVPVGSSATRKLSTNGLFVEICIPWSILLTCMISPNLRKR